jgi:hypothetical protein
VYVCFADVRALENDFELQPILDNKHNNKFIIVNFNFSNHDTELPQTISYTLRVSHNGLETHRQYLKAVQDSYFKPDNYVSEDFPYRQSGFLAGKLAIDFEIAKMLQRDIGRKFDVSV